jgi:hypothetical protein
MLTFVGTRGSVFQPVSYFVAIPHEGILLPLHLIPSSLQTMALLNGTYGRYSMACCLKRLRRLATAVTVSLLFIDDIDISHFYILRILNRLSPVTEGPIEQTARDFHPILLLTQRKRRLQRPLHCLCLLSEKHQKGYPKLLNILEPE